MKRAENKIYHATRKLRQKRRSYPPMITEHIGAFAVKLSFDMQITNVIDRILERDCRAYANRREVVQAALILGVELLAMGAPVPVALSVDWVRRIDSVKWIGQPKMLGSLYMAKREVR